MNPTARPCDELAIRSTRGAVSCTRRQQQWVLVATILGSAITSIDQSMVNIALPAIATDQASSVAMIQWMINGYMICLAAFLLTGGAAGDRFGRRRIFIVGIAIFATASIWCGASSSLTQLIIARVLQGIGAALLIPCSLALIGASFPEAELSRAIGTWAGFSAIVAGMGPWLGGLLVDHFSWRVIFLINPILGILAIWIAWRYLPESYDPEAPTNLDWLGSLLAFGGLGGVAFGLIALSSGTAQNMSILFSLAMGVFLLIAFLWHEQRTHSPMMPLKLFCSRSFSGINVLTLFLYGALGGAFFLLPFELIQVHGYSASIAGLAFLPFTVIMGALSRWFGSLFGPIGPRLPLIIGPTIAAIGFAGFSLSGPTSSYWIAFLLPISIVGLGMAIHVTPLTTAVLKSVPEQQTGVASGVNNSVASLANLLAIVIFGAVALSGFNRSLDHHLQTLSSDAKQTIERASGNFVRERSLTSGLGRDRPIIETIAKDSLAEGIRFAMLLAAGLALAATICAVWTIGPTEARPSPSVR